MKNSLLAAVALLVIAAPASAIARPYTPHHTSAATAHQHNGHHGHAMRHHGHHHHMKAERMQRRANTHNFGNPNARNPSQEGYQQQLGNTTNGPRY